MTEVKLRFIAGGTGPCEKSDNDNVKHSRSVKAVLKLVFNRMSFDEVNGALKVWKIGICLEFTELKFVWNLGFGAWDLLDSRFLRKQGSGNKMSSLRDSNARIPVILLTK